MAVIERGQVPQPHDLVVYVPEGEEQPLPVLNTDLLADLVLWATSSYWMEAQAEDVPEWAQKYAAWGRWNQGSWGDVVGGTLASNGVATQAEVNRCQSSFCIAGNAVAAMGYALLPDSVSSQPMLKEWLTWNSGTTEWQASFAAPRVFSRLDDKGKPVYEIDFSKAEGISDLARTFIGLDYQEASWLFEGSNTIGHIIDYAQRFAAIRGVDLHLPPEVVGMGEPRDNILEYFIGYRQADNYFWQPKGLQKALINHGHLDDEPIDEAKRLLATALDEGNLSEDAYTAAMARLN